MPTNHKRRKILQGLLALTLVLISCDVSSLVAPGPAIPTPPPGLVNTIVADTAQAAASQTATLLPPTLTPTWTPPPTKTPSETPSPSPTFLFLLTTLTGVPNTQEPGSSPKDFSCTLTGQTPEDEATMAKNQPFSVTWTVQNTGVGVWDSRSVDFNYSSGTRLTSLKSVDLPKSVFPGESIDLKLSMEAPGSADTYRTVWTLESGKATFCRLDLTIIVK
jgi:hypothetical protein